MILSKLAQRRLSTLINFMDSLPPSAADHFHMRFWFRHYGGDHEPTNNKGFITKQTLRDCGTAACAAGWAATIPSFRRAGLRVNTSGAISILPEKFFDMLGGKTYPLAKKLFYGNDVKTPKQWAALAKKMLDKYS